MKNLKLLLFSFSILLVSLTIFACSNSSEAKDKTGKEYTSAYICPMHCEGSGNAQAGTCPTCKMAYVANEDYKPEQTGHEGHGHSNHEGHDHSNHDGHNH